MEYKLKDLVEEAKAGSQDAQTELLDRLKPLLLYTLKRYAWGMDWKEMLQEANLAVLEGIREYNEDTGVPFLAYLKTKLAFHIYNQSRKQRVMYSLNTSADEETGQELLDRIADETANPLGDVLRKEHKMAVRSALNRLDPPLRQVILLHYYRGMSLKSIAKAQGVCYKTVLRRKDKALEKLSEILGTYRVQD